MRKEKLQYFKTAITQYNQLMKETNNPYYQPEIKCISDKILLYMRYGIFRINVLKFLTKDDIVKLRERSNKLYELVRGNYEYTNKDPILVAASIIYIASLFEELSLTQTDVAQVFHTSESQIRIHYKRMKKLEKL